MSGSRARPAWRPFVRASRASSTVFAAVACAAALLSPGAVVAQATPDELARRHFESGAAYFQEGDYGGALRAFEKAYELSKRPLIQVNIANVHERLGNLEAAVAALKRYVTEAPDAADVETTRLRIASLERRIQERAAAASSSSSAPPPPPPPGSGGRGLASGDTAGAPPPTASAPPPPPPEEGPGVLPWVLIGIGGVGAIGAGVTGFMAQTEWNDADETCSPRCTDEELSSGRTLAWTSTALTGVAVVGVGVGLALLFTGGDTEAPGASASRRAELQARRPSLAPRVEVGVLPGAARAAATWRF